MDGAGPTRHAGAVVTAATVDTESVVLDGLDFAHVPPCEASPCEPDPRPAVWQVRFHVCCLDGSRSAHLLCGAHFPAVRRLLSVTLPLVCRACGHTMPGRDWVVSVHRIDGGEQS